ncbi:MAG: hypothetical protein R8M46_00645 [Ghiorsea sp.]
MVNYLDNTMNMVNMGGTATKMTSSGLSDVGIGAMYNVYDKGGRQFLTNLGLSLPTGSIDESNAQGTLPYNMQLGSGKYDLIPSFTYQNALNQWSWGLQGSYTLRLGTNNQDYTLGNRKDGQVWAQLNPLESTSVTTRLTYENTAGISGQAKNITMIQANMSPTFDSNDSGGSRVDASVNISHMFESGHIVGMGYGIPIQQNQQGLQMKVKALYNLSWQFVY